MCARLTRWNWMPRASAPPRPAAGPARACRAPTWRPGARSPVSGSSRANSSSPSPEVLLNPRPGLRAAEEKETAGDLQDVGPAASHLGLEGVAGLRLIDPPAGPTALAVVAEPADDLQPDDRLAAAG